jgi:hypothetical protein
MDPDQDSELPVLIYGMYLNPQEIFTDPEHLYYPDQRANLTFFLLILRSAEFIRVGYYVRHGNHFQLFTSYFKFFLSPKTKH